MRLSFRSIILVLLVCIGTFLIFYLSWLPNPDFKVHWYFPEWMARWTNKHGQLRTGVPFLLLGVVIVGLMEKELSRAGYGLLWCGLVGVVVLAEVGQLFLPRRHFDGIDIIWGGVGAAVGLVIGVVGRRIFFGRGG